MTKPLITKSFIGVIPVVFFAFFLGAPAFAQEDAIGRIISTNGSVQARSGTGDMRTLARRSEIFEQDTIITGTDGFAQLRLIDSGMIAFKANTEFTFEEFSYDGAGGAADNAIMSMVQGGFRTISGAIGDDDQDNYRIDTPFASIGIRGTVHEAFIDAGSLLTGVYDGGTTISNNAGTIDTGLGSNFDYSQTFQGQAPIGLLQQPDQLGQIDLNPGAGSDDEEDDSGANGGAGDGNDDASDTDDSESEEEPGFDDLGANDEGDDTAGTDGGDNTGDGANDSPTLETETTPGDTTDTAINPTENVRDEEELEEAGASAEELAAIEASRTPEPEAEVPVVVIEEPVTEPVIVLTPVLTEADIASTQSRLGFTLSRNLASGAIFAGNTSDASNSAPFLLIGNDQTNPRTVNESPTYVFRGNPEILANGILSADGRFTHDVQWGLWGNSSDTLGLFTDFEDDNIVQSINDPMLWASVLPTPIADLIGSHHFSTTANNFIGGSSLGGSFSDLLVSFNVDFGAGAISDGIMSFCINGNGLCNQPNAQDWEFDFSGNVREGFVVANPTPETGEINGENAGISGLIEGVFTGSDSAAFAGGLSLSSTPSASSSLLATTVDALFLIEHEERISNAEIQNFEYDSFLVQEGYARIFLGESGSTPLLFRDGRSTPNLIIRDVGNRVTVSQVNENLGIGADFGVNWERWEGPLNTYTDNFNASIFNDGSLDGIDDIAFFSTFNLSHMSDISGSYNDVIGFIGESGFGGDITEFDMQFSVNFSDGSISNGELGLFSNGSYNSLGWYAFFDGQVQNNTIEFNILPSNPFNSSDLSEVVDYCEGPCGSDGIIGNLQGAFVDNGIEPALLTSFYFRATNFNTPGHNFAGIKVSGQALVGKANTLALVAENGMYENVNFGLVQQQSSYDTYIGLSFDGSPGDFTEPDFSNSTDLFDLNFTDTISGYGGTTVHDVGNFDVDWGIWASSYIDLEEGVAPISDSYDIVWATATAANIADLSGQWNYFDNGEFLGTSDLGSLSDLNMGFSADFNTGLISNGYFSATTGPKVWDLDFTGSIEGARAQMEISAENRFLIYDGASHAANITGDINGIFTGTGSNSAFVTGFSLQADGLHDLNGVGLLTRDIPLSQQAAY